MVELTVRKFGNSLGVVLPKGYRLTPYDRPVEKKMKKADEIIKRYRNPLHVLAK